MDVRVATEKDLAAIINLQKQIYRTDKVDPNATTALRRQLKDETCDVLVVEKNGKVIATSTIYYIEVAVRSRPYALFEGLVVDEAERGQGTGTTLFKRMIEVAKRKNCYKIIFTSGADRKDAHIFYEKMGFKKWGVEFRLDL